AFKVIKHLISNTFLAILILNLLPQISLGQFINIRFELLHPSIGSTLDLTSIQIFENSLSSLLRALFFSSDYSRERIRLDRQINLSRCARSTIVLFQGRTDRLCKVIRQIELRLQGLAKLWIGIDPGLICL